MTGWRTRATMLRLRRALRRRGVPARQRRAIAAEVRSNLHVAAADFGEREALRRLGGVDALADGYAEGRPERRLDVRAGIQAATIRSPSSPR